MVGGLSLLQVNLPPRLHLFSFFPPTKWKFISQLAATALKNTVDMQMIFFFI